MPHRRNPPLPSAPPKRRLAGQPSPQQVSSSLERVRKLARDLPENERSFDPARGRGSWQGSSRDLVVNGEPRLTSGYAYECECSNWKRSPDDDWDTVMVSEEEIDAASYVGQRRIDGAQCSVFQVPGGNTFYAQMSHMTRNASDPELHTGDAWIFDPSVPKDWVDSSARDWEHYSIDARQLHGSTHVGSKLIDGQDCEVFTIDGGHVVAQVPEKITGKRVDPRDIPAHLHRAELRDEPERVVLAYATLSDERRAWMMGAIKALDAKPRPSSE